MSETKARPRILVIDDEPMILQILRAAFDHKEWDVEVVSEGRVAQRRHRERPYDLLIVDKNLPDVDGISMIRELRAEGDQVRVVLITGYGTVTSAVESLNLGVSAYLEKPFRRITEVAATVEDALGRPVKPITAKTLRPAALKASAAHHGAAHGAKPPRPGAKPPRPGAEPPRAAAEPQFEVKTPGGTPVRPPVAAEPAATEDDSDADDDFAGVRTGSWKRQSAPTSTVIIGAPHDDARLRLGAEVTAAHCQPIFADDTMAVLIAVASHDAGLVVLVGSLGRPDTLARLRAQAPAVPCVLITDQVTMKAVKELMQLEATHLITDPPDSDEARRRLGEIVRDMVSGGPPGFTPA
jgi:DNA-binding NtrC family response regulator